MPSFGISDVFFIVFAVRWTILLSLIAFLAGGVGGLIVALLRDSPVRFVRRVVFCYVRLFQGTPLLMQLFLAFFAPSLFGYNVEPLTAAAIGLSLNASAFLGDIWSGCLRTVPHGQREAAVSLGLRYAPRMFFVMIPQAVRIAVPPTVGFLVQLIKGTSLASIIGFVELTQAGEIVNNSTFRPFYVFGLVGTVYFILCWPLSLYSEHLERRLAQARR